MNRLRVNMTAPLNLLTPVDLNLYALVVKFFNSSGAPLNNPNVPNSQTVQVATTSTTFDVDVPIENETFSVSNAQMRVFTTDGGCCFARQVVSFNNIETLNPVFSHEIVQPSCSGTTLIQGRVRLFGVTGGTRYKICYNTTTFTCGSCMTSDGVVNGSGDTLINLTLPASNSTYDFVIRVYNGPTCSFYTDIVGTQEWMDCTPAVIISPQAVLISSLSSGLLYRYEPSNGNLVSLFDLGTTVTDVAHTANKLFVIVYFFDGSGFVSRLKEYNITLNPFTQTFVQNHDMPSSNYGVGLHAESDTEIYICGDNMIKVVISAGVATPTVLFAMPSGYHCTGDLVYDNTTDLFLIAYDNMTDFKIGVFDLTGTLVRSATAPEDDIYGIYQFAGDTFILSGSGSLYQLNLTTLVSTLVGSIAVTSSGASQIQSNISIPS